MEGIEIRNLTELKMPAMRKALGLLKHFEPEPMGKKSIGAWVNFFIGGKHSELKGFGAFVALDKETKEPVGLAMTGPLSEAYYGWCKEIREMLSGKRIDPEKTCLHFNLVVDPLQRKRGIGTFLDEWRARHAKENGFTHAVGLVKPENEKRTEMMKKSGAKYIGAFLESEGLANVWVHPTG